jgi:hypothetical protein
MDIGPILPNVKTAALVLVAFLAGGMCPVYYFQERMRGFGRSLVSRLPYEPPPGKDREEALVDAVEDSNAGDRGEDTQRVK